MKKEAKKKMDLHTYLKKHPRLAIAFSGGVDSVYLLYSAIQAGCDVHAYFIKSDFQPEFEMEDAKRMIAQLGAPFTIEQVSILETENVRRNPENRCYFCKQGIFSRIKELAKADGYEEIADGTNASDDYDDRPGMKALQEMGVISPLRECGITKAEIRRLSKEAGLFTWDKPAYACLATRVPTNTEITKELLKKVEQAEKELFDMGFHNFRVRILKKGAKLQLMESEFMQAIEKREVILSELKKYFDFVVLDFEPRPEEAMPSADKNA